MNGLTIKHFRYLDALARHAHFGRAAAACNISQPALSVQIKELEALVGTPLVERASRRVALTAFGEIFLGKTRDILRSIDDLGDIVRLSRGPMSGHLRVGVIPTIAPYLLPDIISELGSHFPDLQIDPQESVTEKLISRLLDGKLDAAILALPISENQLQELELFREDFVLVRHEAEENKAVPGPEQLHEMKLLLLEEGHCFRDQALSFCHYKQSAPKYLMEGSSLTTLVQMVGAGIGVTLIPEIAVQLETRSSPVSIARFSVPAPSRKIGMVWRKTGPLSEQIMEIGSVVQQVGIRALNAHKNSGSQP